MKGGKGGTGTTGEDDLGRRRFSRKFHQIGWPPKEKNPRKHHDHHGNFGCGNSDIYLFYTSNNGKWMGGFSDFWWIFKELWVYSKLILKNHFPGKLGVFQSKLSTKGSGPTNHPG